MFHCGRGYTNFNNCRTKGNSTFMHLPRTLVRALSRLGYSRAGKSLLSVSDVLTFLALRSAESSQMLNLIIHSKSFY
jgi:hypothetical protein